jgi:hypothetical protein
MNLKGSVGLIGGAITIISGIIGGWIYVQGTIKDAVNTGVTVVTKEMQTSTVGIVSEILRDMRLRHQLLQMDIETLRAEGKPVPDRLVMHERMLAGQIKEVEEKWLKD